MGEKAYGSYNSIECEEMYLSDPGECITKVTFFRDDMTYGEDKGIYGMSYETSKGNFGTIGLERF